MGDFRNTASSSQKTPRPCVLLTSTNPWEVEWAVPALVWEVMVDMVPAMEVWEDQAMDLEAWEDLAMDQVQVWEDLDMDPAQEAWVDLAMDPAQEAWDLDLALAAWEDLDMDLAQVLDLEAWAVEWEDQALSRDNLS